MPEKGQAMPSFSMCGSNMPGKCRHSLTEAYASSATGSGRDFALTRKGLSPWHDQPFDGWPGLLTALRFS
jgi:hypothetical protein